MKAMNADGFRPLQVLSNVIYEDRLVRHKPLLPDDPLKPLRRWLPCMHEMREIGSIETPLKDVEPEFLLQSDSETVVVYLVGVAEKKQPVVAPQPLQQLNSLPRHINQYCINNLVNDAVGHLFARHAPDIVAVFCRCDKTLLKLVHLLRLEVLAVKLSQSSNPMPGESLDDILVAYVVYHAPKVKDDIIYSHNSCNLS